MSFQKIDALKIDYIANFEARKGEKLSNIKSNYQIEQEQKAEQLERLNAKIENQKTNKINSSGQYHL